VLTLPTLQDSNKLLASLLEQQTIIAKQQREATPQHHQCRHPPPGLLAGNMAQVTAPSPIAAKLPHAVSLRTP